MKRWSMASLGAVMMTLLITGQALASTGWLDHSFGIRGVVRLSGPSVEAVDRGFDLATSASGRVYAVGTFIRGESYIADLFARHPSGAAITAFGNGRLRVTWTADRVAVSGVFALPDGGVVVAWTGSDVSSFYERVRRYGPDGRLVTSVNGLPGLRNQEVEHVSRMVRLPGGSLRQCIEDRGSDEVRLVGLTPALGPDDRLGPDRYAVLDAAPCDGLGSDIAGRIYAMSRVFDVDHYKLVIGRYSAHGVLDATYGDSGHVKVDPSGREVAMHTLAAALPDGSMLFAYASHPLAGGNDQVSILHADAAGNAVPSWNGDGTLTLGPSGGGSRLLAIDVDAAGRALVSLVDDLPSGSIRASIVRLTSTGAFDPSFGSGGSVPMRRAARALDVDGSNRIEALSPDGADILLTRRQN